MNLFLSILLSLTAFFNTFGGEEYVAEYFVVTEVQDDHLRSEIIYSTYDDAGGEGLFLEEIQLEKHNLTIEDIEKGDIIMVVWPKDNFENSDWMVMEELRVF